MVVRGRTRNPSGCFAGCLHITRENVNFDVLTGFKACLNDAFSNNILTATVPSFKADLRYTNRKFTMKIYLEMYRSGRNENDSKSCFHFGSPNCRKASNHAGLRASSNCELGSVLSCCSSQFPRLEFCGKMAIMRAAI